MDNLRWEVGLAGEHGAVNALARIPACVAVGVSDAHIAAGLAGAHSSPHRMAVRSLDGLTLIDDTWNANPESMAAVLSTIPELAGQDAPVVLMLGDMLELGEASVECHRALEQDLRRLGTQVPIREVILVGPEMTPLARAMADTDLHHEPVPDADAMKRLAARVQHGDTVLLKGSRSIGLERVVRHLEQEHSAANGR